MASQASALLLLTALTTLIGIPRDPDKWLPISGSVVLLLAVAGLVLLVPADAWGPQRTAGLSLVVLLGLGLSMWCAGERAMMAASGFVLCFAWMGLNQQVRPIIAIVPFGAVVYIAALRAAGTPNEDIASVALLMPIAGLVGVIISQKVTGLKLAQLEIKAEERWRAAIMATLAHDVRAPLTSITGVLELMVDDALTPDSSRPLLAAAQRQASRIMRLATGLLEIERVDQGRLRLDTYEVELLDMLHEIALSQPSMQLRLDVEPGLVVWADRERLEQIIVNLLGNATKHGRPPIEVTARSSAEGVTIRVRDHGSGVPLAAVSGLFDRLGATGPSPQSVGLGLWIVRLLCEAHGGSVEYEAADPGACFVVRLPRGPDHVVLQVDGDDSRPMMVNDSAQGESLNLI